MPDDEKRSPIEDRIDALEAEIGRLREQADRGTRPRPGERLRRGLAQTGPQRHDREDDER